jgi:hypothetical protein
MNLFILTIPHLSVLWVEPRIGLKDFIEAAMLQETRPAQEREVAPSGLLFSLVEGCAGQGGHCRKRCSSHLCGRCCCWKLHDMMPIGPHALVVLASGPQTASAQFSILGNNVSKLLMRRHYFLC